MKKIGIILIATVLATSAFGQTTTTAETKIEKKENLEKYKRVVVDESMFNREGKKYTLNATLFGMNFGSPEAAIEAGYHTQADTIIGLSLHNLTGSNLSDDDSGDEYVFEGDGKGTAISLSLKKFTTNSFYIKPAIYHRSQTTIKSGIKSYNSATDSWMVDSRNTAEYTDMGVSFAIGNQWQWETFTIGCNWIGLSRSLTTLSKKGSLTQNELNSGSGLNFYMGATF